MNSALIEIYFYFVIKIFVRKLTHRLHLHLNEQKKNDHSRYST
jgi:hypothetical protein